jgi:hypothetical protein
MSRREKMLMIAVVGVLGFGISVKLIRTLVDKTASLDRQITARKERLAAAETERRLVKTAQRPLWQEIAKETLSTDVDEAAKRLMDRIDALARKHDLKQRAVRPQGVRGRKSGFARLGFSVNGQADLLTMVDFLYDLHSLPFLVRVESFRLSPVSNKDRKTLKLTLKGETIVLPEHPVGGQDVATMAKDAKPIIRTRLASAAEYHDIATKGLFEPSKPPPPKPIKPTKPPEPPDHRPTPTPTPRPPARDPQRTSTRIAGLIGTPDMQEVVLARSGNRREAVPLYTKFDGGILIFVHPEGAVAVYQDKLWFYPLGKLMSEGIVLTEDVQPEVFHIVSQMDQTKSAKATETDETQDSTGPATTARAEPAKEGA